MRALSIRQPWAWLIVNGHKPVENRDWESLYRGPLLIHAAKGGSLRDYCDAAEQVAELFDITVPEIDQIERGGVVGMARLTGCVRELDSQWFTGPFGFLLADARPLPFTPMKGALGFFHVPAERVGLPAEVAP